MNAATQNEMERLVRVNREQQALLDQIYQYVDEQGLAKLGQSRVKALIEAHKRAEEERGALSAHLERLRKASLDAIHYLPGGEIKAELRDAYDDTPETNLSRQKAKWQAEAMAAIGATLRIHGQHKALGLVAELAARLRRQAEAATAPTPEIQP